MTECSTSIVNALVTGFTFGQARVEGQLAGIAAAATARANFTTTIANSDGRKESNVTIQTGTIGKLTFERIQKWPF